MAELTTMQSMKQSTRNFMHKASDKVKVAGAKASRADTKDLDIAIVKATTSNFHVAPKEKHVRTLKSAVHASRQRRDVTYVIGELHKRLQDSTDWLTALKTLITIHRLMRETDPSFLEELVKLSSHLTHGKGRLLNMDNFIDRTNIEGRFDFSEWVRAYGKYLDEQLDAYTAINWYVEAEQPGGESRMRALPPRDLLFQLPHLQRLQRRLLDCVPKGQAARDPVVLYALGLVVKESFTLYKAVSEGVINLADTFFEMEYLDAIKGLELYKESIASNDALGTYYATIEQIEEVKRAMQLPKLSAPPTDFVKSMEQYIHEAPRAAEGEAHKKAAPLRRGKLAASGKWPGAGATAGVVADSTTSRDPGMVLPVGLPASAASGDGPASPGTATAATSPTSATAAAGAGGGVVDLLGFGDLTLQAGASGSGAATPAPIGAGKTPTPLDLLSGLDFSYAEDPAPSAVGDPALASASSFGAPAPGGSSNPFAAPAAPQPPQQQQLYGGAPMPMPAYGASASYQTYSLGGYGAPAGQYLPPGQPPLPSPGSGAAPHDWALPSPLAISAPTAGSSPGGLDSLRSSGGNPLRVSGNGLAGTPVRSPSNNVDLFKQAGAHDHFASLTGLPKAGTPGSAKPSPTKASPSLSPNTSSGNLWA